MLKAINESYDDKEFSFIQREGIITCSPKVSKDKIYLQNWRPITLLHTVYRIASSCIAKRIKPVMDNIIKQEQKGFVKGRYIGENIRTLYDVLYWTSEKIWIGSSRNSSERLCQDYKLNWNQGPFEVLGIIFSTKIQDIPKLSYEGISEKIKSVFK